MSSERTPDNGREDGRGSQADRQEKETKRGDKLFIPTLVVDDTDPLL